MAQIAPVLADWSNAAMDWLDLIAELIARPVAVDLRDQVAI
jgi:hypothetical protein